jgi:hypothetical protein
LMFSTPTGPAIAGIQSLVVAAFFLFLGGCIVDLTVGKRLNRSTVWGLSIVGLAFYALCLMLLHIVTGGRVFANPWLVRALTIVVVVAWIVLSRRRSRAGNNNESAYNRWRGGLVALGVLAGLAILAWGVPIFQSLPLPPSGDVFLHNPYTSQLLNGELTPTAPITGDIPNFYPWLFHAVQATVTCFMPGGRAFHSQNALQIILPVGSVWALFALGRELTRSIAAGMFAALFGALTGGFGFVMLHGIDAVIDPNNDATRYMGDLLLRRSYNASFYNVAPPFPRDLGYALLAGAFVLLVGAIRTRKTLALMGTGTALGMVGLASLESFLVGTTTAVVVVLIAGRTTGRLRALVSVLLPALGVYSLWLIPQAINFIELGGYVNLTLMPPVVLPPLAILVSWGVVTPLAIFGIRPAVVSAREDPGARLLITLTLVAGGFVILTSVGSSLLSGAFDTVGRAHRYWPLLYLAVALLAAVAAWRVWSALVTNRRSLAIALSVLLALVGMVSPIVASLAFARGHVDREVHSAVRGREDALLNLLSPHLGERCVAAVPLELDQMAAAYSGYRFVAYKWARPIPGNGARIRWSDIYERITSEAERIPANFALTHARGIPASWRSTAERFGVDVVVIRNEDAASAALEGVEIERATDVPYSVARLSDCGV